MQGGNSNSRAPANSIGLCVLALSGWMVASILKEWPFLAPRSLGFSNFRLRQQFPYEFFWTYPAETGSSRPLQHKNQGHTPPRCSQRHPEKHNVTTFQNVRVHGIHARAFVCKPAAARDINTLGQGRERYRKKRSLLLSLEMVFHQSSSSEFTQVHPDLKKNMLQGLM